MKIFTLKQRLIVLTTTISVAAAFILVGYLIGNAVNNVTAGLIVAVLVSYPFTQFTLIKALNRTTRNYSNENEAESTDSKN